MYFAVEGTTSACPFVIEAEAIYNCDADTTCSNNGECRLNGSCICFEDSKNGYWAGRHCDECHPLYKGSECKTPICSSEMLCNGNGVCNDDQCECFNNNVRGFWAGARCNFCASGYFGPECKDLIGNPIWMYLILALCAGALGVIGQRVYYYIKSTTSMGISNPSDLSDLEHALLRSGDDNLL
ncbi:hypothetical protein GEMRC1_003135 [Eukaryota sp. GEM-RC1]